MEEPLCDTCKYTETSCICSSKWKMPLKEMVEYKMESDVTDITPLSVSTMTVCFKMSNCTFDITKFCNEFQPNSLFKETKYKKGSKKSKDEELHKNMYNQCTLSGPFREFPKRCAKVNCKKKNCCARSNLSLFIFKNGSFKITGIKKNENIVYVVRFVDKMMKKSGCVNVIDNTQKCIMQDVRICMINTNYNIGLNVNQSKLNEILNQDCYSLEKSETGAIVSCVLDKEVHQGVNIKIVHRKLMEREMKQINKKQLLLKKPTTERKTKDKPIKKLLTRKGREKLPYEVTALVFKSGSIILTGGKSDKEISFAYQYLNSLIQVHADEVLYE